MVFKKCSLIHAETNNDIVMCSSSSYPLVSFQFSGVIVSSLSNFAQVKTETQTVNIQPFPDSPFFPSLPLSTQKPIWVCTAAPATLQLGHKQLGHKRSGEKPFLFEGQLYTSQVSMTVLDYPDIHSVSGRQVTGRWIRSQPRRQDIPETQFLQQNNNSFSFFFFFCTSPKAGRSPTDLSCSASLWIPYQRGYPVPPFQETLFPLL